MKKNWKSGSMIGLTALLLFLLAACNNHSGHSKPNNTASAYQCPMKCEGEKTYAQPGSCPVCKMDLTPVDSHSGHQHESTEQDSSSVYTCPMHPEVVQNAPGSCPVCKMDLVKKKN